MAITSGNGTVSTTTTPASTLLAALDAVITGITGWSKVSSAIVVGTNTWNVYKSAAANNSFGSDFYVAIGYVTATPTSLLMTVFESWNSGTNLATNFAPNSAQTPTVTTWANPNAAAALPSTGTTMAILQQLTAFSTLTAISYWYAFENDKLAFGWNWTGATTQEGFYLGLYDSFQNTTNDPFPLCAAHIGSNTGFTNGGSMTTGATTLPGLSTREPRQTASAAANFGVGASSATNWSATAANTQEIYTGAYIPSRVLLVGRSTTAYRGLLKNMWIGPVQSNNGDIMQWTLAGVTTNAVRLGSSASAGIYAQQ